VDSWSYGPFEGPLTKKFKGSITDFPSTKKLLNSALTAGKRLACPERRINNTWEGDVRARSLLRSRNLLGKEEAEVEVKVEGMVCYK